MNGVEINQFLKEHNAIVHGDRLILTVRCDSTYIFLYQMVAFLEAIGCTDIEHNGNEEDDTPYGFRYTASGKMPEWFAKCLKPMKAKVVIE